MPTLKICDFSSPVIIGGQQLKSESCPEKRAERQNRQQFMPALCRDPLHLIGRKTLTESDKRQLINRCALAIRIGSRLISRAKKVVCVSILAFSHSSTCGERVNRRVLVINRILQICGPPRLDLCARRVSSSHARSALRTTAAMHSDQYLISLIKIPVRRAYREEAAALCGGGVAFPRGEALACHVN